MAEAFRDERVAVTHTLEKTPPAEIADLFITMTGDKPNLWRRLKTPMYSFIKFAPRGWVHQNMVNVAALGQTIVDSFDLTNNLVLPGKTAAGNRELGSFKLRLRPYTFLAAITVPNYIRALQTLARIHTLANETQIVCASGELSSRSR